ncbi:Uu.00g048360.m01.CDS01 [Anthostomella pinea]|uniref:Uu.00g048360.m01.CDS01 n=1 Tax=Anthostomella pinea TaxID=933095 RepID=A0AAI8V6P1_9PEZI|nr:Uu.00g048360.m01.CDS01 [Anthostomella pinea]
MWRDIATAQYYHGIKNVGSSEIAICGLAMGMDRYLFYIRQLHDTVTGDKAKLTGKTAEFYAYNVEALLALFWAGALAQSIYGLTDLDVYKRVRWATQVLMKAVAVLLPVLLMCLLQLDAVRRSFAAFLLVADACST